MNAPIPAGALDRTQYIGGADVAAVLGVSPWMTPFMLYQKKVGAFVEEVTPAKQRIFDRGHRWEPIVVEMLVDELRDRGHDVEIIGRNRRYIDPELPFIAAEIDLELRVDGEEVNAEAKTVTPFAAKLWGEEDSDEVPIYYAAQVMHGLMVQPRRRTVIAAVTGFDDKPRVHWIERDDETITAIRAREVEFWRRVQAHEPPDPTSLEDIKFLFPRDAGTLLEADDELVALCAELKAGKAEAKELDARLETLATRLRLRMGDAATLVHGGKTIASWKSNKDSVTTDWNAAYLDLRPTAEHTAQFTSTKPGARPLLIK
jgi:putative phage-type endonuclease